MEGSEIDLIIAFKKQERAGWFTRRAENIQANGRIT
jgi:hypothetical protein